MTVVDASTLPYRRNVGVMAINRTGHVWIGRRIDASIYFTKTSTRSCQRLGALCRDPGRCDWACHLLHRGSHHTVRHVALIFDV